MSKQKLELTWIGKDEQIKLEPRILIEDPKKSYGDPKTENMLIHGDNLLALKALEQDFSEKIKCIYIDPPYNTGSAFEHYDDGVEHSTWLSLLRARIQLLRRLLSKDGSLWISIDDYECHYLKIMCDEIFGRNNFVTTIIWQQRTTRENRKTFSNNHEYILLYAKDYQSFASARNALDLNDEVKERYKNPDNDSRGSWQSISANAQAGHATPSQFYTLIAPNGKKHNLPNGRCWLYTETRIKEEIGKNNIWFGKDGNGVPRIKKFLSEVKGGLTPETSWLAQEVGTNDLAKKMLLKMFPGASVFDTPKPEELIYRVLHIATNPDDWVLDSFLGSGTTSSVAHKMGRRWIGIELGEHCYTHCLPRLQKVIDKNDLDGISKIVNWKGGGGFKFFNLAPSLLRKDKFGNWIIDEKYNANMLAAAMCKHEGFKFFPDAEIYWRQGKSTESDYIFVTTAFVTVEQVDKIHAEMRKGESLLICAKSFAPACKEKHSNITIKKIPQVVLGKCEFGKDNYDLNIVNTPKDDDEEDSESDEPGHNEKSKAIKEVKSNKTSAASKDLFKK